MAGLVPFNQKNNSLARTGTDFEDFYNMLDDYQMSSRNLVRDTFKIYIEQTDNEYLIEAELPGVKKDEINLSIDNDNLCISVNRAEEVNKNAKNYIHRERRSSSMGRRVHMANAKLDEI